MSDWKLSDKLECVAIFGNQYHIYLKDDVREFIKKLKEEIKGYYFSAIEYITICKIINELAGDDLIKAERADNE